jgi:hypothetical protein
MKDYFRYLDLVREDIREELKLLGYQPGRKKICDFGCGNGLTTFALAIEAEGSECIGVDLFDDGIPQPDLNQYIESIKRFCSNLRHPFSREQEALCQLVASRRIPTFRVGNIVNNINLPENLDLAYCKKLFVNIYGKSYKDTPSGEDGLNAGLLNIRESLRRDGMLFVVEYDKEFKLRKYFERCNFNVVEEEILRRREIRSRGRTSVISSLTLYLCEKSS